MLRQDGKGYIWVGTDMGINRYDGRTFKYFPNPGPAYQGARYAARYKDSVIFSIDFYGVAICYGDSVRFVKRQSTNTRLINGIACINDSSFLVANAATGLSLMSPQRAENVILPSCNTGSWNIADIYKDNNSNVWVLCGQGLVFMNAGDIRHPVVLPFFNDVYINVVRQARNGDVYVATQNGLYKYTKDQIGSITSISPQMILPAVAQFTSITFDNDDNIWMTSTFKGLARYNKTSRTLHFYNTHNGLVSQNTWDAFCDIENNIWICSENGISKLTTQYYYSFDFTNTDYQNVKNACVWNDSEILLCNLMELYKYSRDTIEKVSGYENLPGYVRDIFLKTPDNKLLADINRGISTGGFAVETFVYDLVGNSLKNKKNLKNMPGGVGRIYMDQGAIYEDDRLFVNTPAGLRIYRDGKMLPGAIFTNDTPLKGITYMAGNDKGDYWFLLKYRDLIRCKRISDKATVPFVLDRKEFFDGAEIGDVYFSKIFVDSRGIVWVNSREKGACRIYTDQKGDVVRVEKPDSNMFSSGLIIDMAEDKEHNLWVATAAGLDKVTFDGDQFKVEKGMYSTELCGKYIYFIRIVGDKLFAGTSGCVGVIDLYKKMPYIAPSIYISGIRINEVDALNRLHSNPRLNTNENTFSFTFTGINYRDERHTRYSYTLEGLDKNWSQPSTDYRVVYSQLPPGEYTFKVKALSANGVWSVKPATFSFTILQPFYTRWWFVTLIVICISGIVYGVYRYRINQILQIQRMRQRISKDLHDDIGATVSSINILANMAKSDLVSENKRNQFLETIQEESKHVSESLNDIVWSINPKNDSLEVMFARMQRYASELFEARNIAYDFVLPDEGAGNINMEMDRRQHIYLIFKEAINNLVKYSGATKADVVFKVSNSEFSFIISDNGKGFDTKAGHAGNGIYNMQKRAEDIGASLEINSKPGTGTNVLFSLLT